MEIQVFLTHEISTDDWAQITSGFNRSFDMEKKNNELPEYYKRNLKGYSYHAICRSAENRIIAHTSIVPQLYTVNGEEYWFGLSGGSYVLKEHRQDAFLYSDINNAVFEKAKQEHLLLAYGVPNKNVFHYNLKILGSTYIKDLNYYLLPLSPLKLLTGRSFLIFDLSFLWLQRIWIGLNRGLSSVFNSSESTSPIQLQLSELYFASRFDDKYGAMREGKCTAYYRMKKEKGVNAAYLMDYRNNGKRDYRSLSRAVSYIVRNEKVDVILIVGGLPILQWLFIKLPKRFVPKQMPLTINIIQRLDDRFTELLQRPENWDVGLMNIDVR